MDKIEKIRAEIKRLITDPTLCSTTERKIGGHTALLKLVSFIDSLQQEQPEEPDKSLEEEVKNYFQGYWPGTETAEQCNTDLHFTPPAIIRLARHFYELGKQAMKEQMLKDAVEGEIQMRYSGCLCAKTIRAINEDKFKLGDKVRIIIVKED